MSYYNGASLRTAIFSYFLLSEIKYHDKSNIIEEKVLQLQKDVVRHGGGDRATSREGTVAGA